VQAIQSPHPFVFERSDHLALMVMVSCLLALETGSPSGCVSQVGSFFCSYVKTFGVDYGTQEFDELFTVFLGCSNAWTTRARGRCFADRSLTYRFLASSKLVMDALYLFFGSTFYLKK
jgi:hypothetical protein